MFKDFKIQYSLLGILILILFVLGDCHGPRWRNPGNGVHHSDTVRVTTYDTVYFHDTIVKEIKAEIPIPIEIHDTLYLDSNTVVDTFNLYVTKIEDSLIKGTITSKIDGTLLDQSLNYVPLFPMYIYKTDSVTITNAIDKSFLFLGAEVGGNSAMFNLSPVIGIYKKGYFYSYRYGLLDKTHNVTISKRISFKRRH